MNAQPRLGLTLSGPGITCAFLIEVAVLVLASHLPRAPQPVAAVGDCRRRGGGRNAVVGIFPDRTVIIG